MSILKLTKTNLKCMKNHAITEYPKEACGIISGKKYIKLKNIAENPLVDFVLPDDTFIRYKVDAIFHSHPGGPVEPTYTDMKHQIMTDVPWVICASYKDEVSEPYIIGSDYMPFFLGREFRHGPSGTDNKGDCYALIRDWYNNEMHVDLPEFPRSNFWWENSPSLYEENFNIAGFEKTNDEDRKIGDICLMQINSPVINHAAIYVGEGMILHHLTNRLSRREPATIWRKLIKYWIRYKEVN